MEIFEGKTKATGKLHIELRGPDGELKDERFVHNVVTNLGSKCVATRLISAATDVMSHMAIGDDDDPAPAAADTALNNEIHREILTSSTQGTGANDNDIVYIGDYAAGHGTNAAIVEAGIFNGAGVGTTTMLCRAKFAAINKGASDTLKITWTVTLGT